MDGCRSFEWQPFRRNPFGNIARWLGETLWRDPVRGHGSPRVSGKLTPISIR
jgi:hypothetical protein